MLLVSQLLVAAVLALVFWHWVSLGMLLPVLPTIVSAVAILLAAVFVRLNRGLPAIDWKNVAPQERRRLTEQLLNLSYEYAGALCLGVIFLFGVIGLIAPGQAAWGAVSHCITAGLSATFAFLASLLVFRMGYIVWRDIDIVKLQKAIIDRIEDREADEAARKREVQSATDRVEAMRKANLRAEPIKTSTFS